MFHSKLVRLLAIATVAASASVAAFAGPASAATLSIKCSSMTGNIASTVTLSGCKGNTGGASMSMAATALASGGTVNWVNGQSTTVTLAVAQKGTSCPAGSSEYQAKGKVTADTTGSATVGGNASAKVCVDATGNITLVPKSKATI